MTPATVTAIPDTLVATLHGVERLATGLTAAFLERFGVLPLRVGDGRVRVATWRERVDEQALDDLRLAFAAEVELVRLPEADVRNAIRRARPCCASSASMKSVRSPVEDRSRCG